MKPVNLMKTKDMEIASRKDEDEARLSAGQLILIGLLVPTIMSLMAWLIENSRGVGNGTGLEYQLLFNPGDIFTDWLIPNAWAHEPNPWKYVGSRFEGLLPPSLYGPTIFMVLRLLPGTEGPNQVYIIVHIVFMLILGTLSGAIIIMSSKNIGKVGANDLLIQVLLLSSSYPLVFCMQRGNTAVISYFLLSITVYLIIKEYESCLWAVPLTLYCFSSLQLVPLFALLAIASFQSKRTLLYTLGCTATFLIYIVNTGVSTTDIIATLKKASTIVKGMGYIYNHDLYSAMFQLWHGQGDIAKALYCIGASLIIFTLLKLVFSSQEVKQLIEPRSLFAVNSNCARYMLLSWIFGWNILTLIFSVPSADYHLLRILPFLAIAVNPTIDKYLDSSLYKVNKYEKGLVFLSSGYVLSYSKLWGFLGITDLSVTVRCACLIVLLIQTLRIGLKASSLIKHSKIS